MEDFLGGGWKSKSVKKPLKPPKPQRPSPSPIQSQVHPDCICDLLYETPCIVCNLFRTSSVVTLMHASSSSTS